MLNVPVPRGNRPHHYRAIILSRQMLDQAADFADVMADTYRYMHDSMDADPTIYGDPDCNPGHRFVVLTLVQPIEEPPPEPFGWEPDQPEGTEPPW